MIRFALALLLFSLTGLAQVSGIIASSNRVDWIPGQTIGVPGGIPNRTTIYTNMSTSATASEINSAITACPSNQVVQLAGTNAYSFSSTVINLKAGVTLRGRTGTSLTGTAGTIVNIAGTSTSFSATNGLFSGYTKGSSNIVLSAGTVSAGQYIALGQHDDTNVIVSFDGGADHFNPLHRVDAVTSGTNVTIWPPVIFTLQAALVPVYRVASGTFIEYAGLENVLVIPGAGTDFPIQFNSAAFCWASNVVVTNIQGQCGFYAYDYHRIEIRHCAVRKSISAGDGYGIDFDILSSPHVGGLGAWVEDCFFDGMYHSFIISGTDASVFSYNFSTNEHANSGVTYQTAAFNATHGPGGLMALWEGNIGNYFTADQIHGNVTHQTLWRNKLHGLDQNASGAYTCTNSHGAMIDPNQGSYWWNMVGNVLGDPSWSHIDTNTYFYEISGPQWDAASSCVNGGIYKLGYVGFGSALETKVKSSSVRYRNYDYFNSSIQSDGGISGTNDYSLLYSSRPSWFPSCSSWPPVDESAPTQSITNVPAAYRYIYSADSPCSGGGSTGPYYISPTGNDSNDGLSTSAPWTVTNGLAHLGPDITVYAMDGIYSGLTWTIASANSGSNGHNATLKSLNKWGAINANAPGLGIDLSYTPYVTNLVIDGIVVTNSTSDGIGFVGNSNYLLNCWIVGNTNQGINMSNAGCSNNVIDSCLVELNGKIANGVPTNAHYHGVYIAGQNHIIRNNVVRRNYSGSGLHMYTEDAGVHQWNNQEYNNLVYGHTNFSSSSGMVNYNAVSDGTVTGTNYAWNNTVLDGWRVSYGVLCVTNNISIPTTANPTEPIIESGARPPTLRADYNGSTVAYTTAGAHDTISSGLSTWGFVNTNTGLYWLTSGSAARTKAQGISLATDFFSHSSPTITDLGAFQYSAGQASDTRTLDPNLTGADYWTQLSYTNTLGRKVRITVRRK